MGDINNALHLVRNVLGHLSTDIIYSDDGHYATAAPTLLEQRLEKNSGSEWDSNPQPL